MKAKPKFLAAYEVRQGRDGKTGIYLRAYNVRLATFAADSKVLQANLKEIFDRAHRRAQKAKQ